MPIYVVPVCRVKWNGCDPNYSATISHTIGMRIAREMGIVHGDMVEFIVLRDKEFVLTALDRIFYRRLHHSTGQLFIKRHERLQKFEELGLVCYVPDDKPLPDFILEARPTGKVFAADEPYPFEFQELKVCIMSL